MPQIENYEEVAELLAWSPRKAKNLTAALSIRPQLMEGVTSMFERSGYPESVNVKMLERFLVTYGIAGIARYPEDGKSPAWGGEWTACKLTLGGAPDPDGLGQIAICTWGDGTVREFKDWRDSEDVIVCWNAWDYSIDINIPETARKVMIADVSLDVLVKNSRLHPIPVARDSKEQNAIQTVQSNILDGQEQTVISVGDTQDLLDAIGNASSKIDVLSITDPSAAVHIQNISQYREDLLRWFWNLYGMDSRGSTKRAQQSVEEIDQGGDLSMIIPMSRWRARQEEVEQVRVKCGASDAACDFSACWKSRIMEAITIDDETSEELDVENIVTEEQEPEDMDPAQHENQENDEKEDEDDDEESEAIPND